MRLSWQEDMLRWKLCFDSRKKRNASSAKPAKRRKWQSGKDWRKRHEKNRCHKLHLAISPSILTVSMAMESP